VSQSDELRKWHPDFLSIAGEVSWAIEGQATVIRLSGAIDLVLRADLDWAAYDAIALGLPVRVNVSEMTFMDSVGIGFLAQLLRAGLRPELVGASRRTIELVDVSGLRHALTLVSADPDRRDRTQNDALDALGVEHGSGEEPDER
jgi:anti-anti-sigma factor